MLQKLITNTLGRKRKVQRMKSFIEETEFRQRTVNPLKCPQIGKTKHEN